jgi:hypothetical protein
MSDLRQTSLRLWAAGAGLILVVLVWQWFSLGSTRGARLILPDAIPELATVDINTALTDILEHNLWEPERKAMEAGDGAEVGEEIIEAAPQVTLQFKALVKKGESLLAVIGENNDPASFKNYAEGDTLPNGQVLLYIDADKITIGDLPGELDTSSSSDAQDAPADTDAASAESTETPDTESAESTDATDAESTEASGTKPATTTLYLFGRTGSASE